MSELYNILNSGAYVACFNPNGHASGFRPLVMRAEQPSFTSPECLPLHQPALFFCSYDHKNKIEALKPASSRLAFPDQLYFECDSSFVPEPSVFLNNAFTKRSLLRLQPVVSKERYIENVKALKEHIRKGDIYEINYCIAFEAENASVDPADLYLRLNALSKAPYSALIRLNDKYVISSSPELFLSRRGQTLFTKPIKGTSARSADAAVDELSRTHLQNSLKERTENVMIVDVARNDLSRIAARGSVKVDKLYDIESYSQVHQMVSTVSCTLPQAITPHDIISATFPMASMTGAPKVRAMQLIDDREARSRGPYSGCIGYVLPNGDMDLSVLIRSIFYNASEKFLSFSVGSAITHLCDPEQEYEECLLKAKAMMQVLGA